jgi:DNA invertase Pin-like site-specific DNA recombinase
MSIVNQQKLLRDYVKEMGWNLQETYIDDGYTGTNFDRPDFKRMIRDIESGRLNCIIVKDLSRLGRNYVECGYYTDEFFLKKGVRFIAVNDGIDTMEDNDMMPFHHVVNEIYPKQVSRKVRQVKASTAKQGKFIGSQAPYGYQKSPHDRYLLIPDEPAAAIIRRIFSEYASGISARAIGTLLTTDGVDSPKFYHYGKLGKATPSSDDKNSWGSGTILQIIRNRVYIGDMVQGKRSAVSYKVKKRYMKAPDDWIVVEGTHEPLVTRDMWDKAQERGKLGYSAHMATIGTIGLFAGVLRCAECGNVLAYMRRPIKGGELGAYRCGRYNNNGRESCTTHYISEATLSRIILEDIRRHAQIADRDRAALVSKLMKSVEQSRSGTVREIKAKLREVQTRLDTASSMVKNLYEDKVAGKLPEDIFQSLIAGYSDERAELDTKRASLHRQLGDSEDLERKVSDWVTHVSAFTGIDSLDRATVSALIESITVSEAPEVGKKQEVTINYRYMSKFIPKTKEGIA